MTLRPGQPAPSFVLPDASGDLVSLTDFIGQKAVVLFFYPKDETPGCTREACEFRDHHREFEAAGAEVLGVSSDSPASHHRFQERYGLPFRLLSDLDGRVRKAYGVSDLLGVLPRRVSFVIDRAGIIRFVHESQLRPRRHVTEALRMLRACGSNAGQADSSTESGAID